MIVPMRKLALLCLEKDREGTLETLRDLGCVQLDLAHSESADAAAAKTRLTSAARAVQILEKAYKTVGRKVADVARLSPSVATRLRDAKTSVIVDEVIAADKMRVETAAEADRLRRLLDIYEPFGDVDPSRVVALAEAGVELTLVRAPGGADAAAAREAFADGEETAVAVVAAGKSGGYAHFAIVRYPGAGAAPELPQGWERVNMPPESVAALRGRLAETETRLAAQTLALAAAHDRVRDIKALCPQLAMDVDFAAAAHSLSAEGPIAWVTGWIPEDAVPALRAQAVSRAWGIATRAPEAGEEPPVLIRPPKLFRAMTAIFGGLGIAPAYGEADVSVPFMCYFSLFFAMLVGDGGYGALMFAATLYGWRRTRPRDGDGRHRPRAVRSWLTLMTVFSFATVCWGAISNTWFGAELPWCRDWRTAEWLGDPSYRNMMFLCFTIGASHLVLARVWSGVCMFGRSACLAEFGWAGILVFMYFVVNWLVGVFSGLPAWTYWLFGVSAALVASRARGVELGMLPLNIMGTLGDIISYVRLFAVGFASLMVARNFNEMAVGLALPVWLKAVPMVLILLLGHGLNLALAALSVLVHAVRLNTLEFSNHRGISWAGSAFKPFRKL